MPYKDKEEGRKQSLRWSEENLEKSRQIKQDYEKRNREKISARQKLGRLKNPEREKANNKFRYAVKMGWIERPEGMQFHHPDYSRPYYGVWVTAKDHRRIHAGMLDCPKCIDFEKQVQIARGEK